MTNKDMTIYGLLTTENKKIVKHKYGAYKLKQTCDNALRVVGLGEPLKVFSEAENTQALHKIIETLFDQQQIVEKIQ